MSDHYEQLADVLSEFAQTMLTDFPIDSILDQLVKRIVELLPITAAGVTLITPPLVPHYVVASDPLAMRFEQLQTDIGEGPCLLAYHSGSPVVEGNLRTCTRFPLFAGPAVAAGLGAVFAFPLKHGQAPLGALGLYRDSPGLLSPPATRAAKILADVAAAYLLNAQNRLALQQAADVAQSKSLHDQLTGLPNRTLLLERLTHAFLRSRRTAAVSALLFVDVDAFKRSTTSTATPPAMTCSSPSPTALHRCCAPPTPCPGYTATSSSSSAKTCTIPGRRTSSPTASSKRSSSR